VLYVAKGLDTFKEYQNFILTDFTTLHPSRFYGPYIKTNVREQGLGIGKCRLQT